MIGFYSREGVYRYQEISVGSTSVIDIMLVTDERTLAPKLRTNGTKNTNKETQKPMPTSWDLFCLAGTAPFPTNPFGPA